MNAVPVLAVLVALLHPSDDAERARLASVAADVAAVSATVDDAALLLAIAQHESGLRRDVDLGEKRGTAGECGLWQLMPRHQGPCFEVAGSRRAQATFALALAHRSIARCGHGDAALAAYASGRCDRGLTESRAMVRSAARLVARLTAASSN